MKLHTKIKAFTLTEMIIVIVISTVVAGLAFTILSVLQKNMRSIEFNYSEKTTIRHLEQSLVVDFNRYTKVFWDPNQEVLSFESPIEQKEYVFYTDSIVSGMRTFKLQLKAKALWYRGDSITTGPLDAIRLRFSERNDFQRIFVFKYEDPTDDFQQLLE